MRNSLLMVTGLAATVLICSGCGNAAQDGFSSGVEEGVADILVAIAQVFIDRFILGGQG